MPAQLLQEHDHRNSEVSPKEQNDAESTDGRLVIKIATDFDEIDFKLRKQKPRETAFELSLLNLKKDCHSGEHPLKGD